MCNDNIMYRNRIKYSNFIMRIIIAKFEIEDNDLIEHKLFTALDSLGCKDFTKLPDTKELYDTDQIFRSLCRAEKVAKNKKKDYIAKNKLKLKQ